MAQRRRSPPPSNARGRKNDVSADELSASLVEVEKSLKQEAKQRALEKKQHDMELASAKKNIAKEIRSATTMTRKKEMEVKRMEQRLGNTDRQKDTVVAGKSRQVAKLDQKIDKIDGDRNTYEATMAAKMAGLGEAKGRLAHAQFAERMLQKGMIIPIDANGRVDASGLVLEHLQDGKLRMRDEDANAVAEYIDDASFPADDQSLPADSQSPGRLQEVEIENERLAAENVELLTRLQITENYLREMEVKAEEFQAASMVVRQPSQPTPDLSASNAMLRQPSSDPYGSQPWQQVQRPTSSAQYTLGSQQAMSGAQFPYQMGAGRGYQMQLGPQQAMTPGQMGAGRATMPQWASLQSQSPSMASPYQTYSPSSMRAPTPTRLLSQPMSTTSNQGAYGSFLAAPQAQPAVHPSPRFAQRNIMPTSATPPYSSAGPPPGAGSMSFQVPVPVPFQMGGKVGGAVQGIPFVEGIQPLSLSASQRTTGLPVQYQDQQAVFTAALSQSVTQQGVSRRDQSQPRQTQKRGSITTELFDALDRNHDGVLTREEFRAGMQGHIIPGPPGSHIVQGNQGPSKVQL